MLGELAREMHRAERMLKPAMLRGRVNPTRALELIDVAESLHPWRVDDLFFRHLAFSQRNRELDIMVDGIGQERCAFVFAVQRPGHGLHSSSTTWAVH